MSTVGKCLGYLRYSRTDGGGKYLHREVAEGMLGRPLLDGEVVHHEDRDRSNNDPSNLMVFKTNSDHGRHHRGTGTLIQLEDGAYVRYVNPVVPKARLAKVVAEKIDRPKYKIEWPDREALHRMVWNRPTWELGIRLGVSDSAIAKRCRNLGIPKPPRGWWAQLESRVYGLSCPLLK